MTNADLEDSLDILQAGRQHPRVPVCRCWAGGPVPPGPEVNMQANIIGQFDDLLIAEAPAMRTWLQGKQWLKAGCEICGVTARWESGNRENFTSPPPKPGSRNPRCWCWPGKEQLERFDTSIAPADKTDRHQPPCGGAGRRPGRPGSGRGTAYPGIDYCVVEKKTRYCRPNTPTLSGSAADREIP